MKGSIARIFELVNAGLREVLISLHLSPVEDNINTYMLYFQFIFDEFQYNIKQYR